MSGYHQLKDADLPMLKEMYLIGLLGDAVFALHAAADNLPEKVVELRLDALGEAHRRAQAFRGKGFSVPQLVGPMLEKKIAYIMEATSKTQIEEIFRPQLPHYNGEKLITVHSYPIEEEEILCWSMASTVMKPTGLTSDRMMELFEDIYGCSLDEYLNRQEVS